jgi:endonuclease/exonuclease/phosphatase family metal-dependent hydrolase
MRLATYNIQYGFGRDRRCDLARAIAAVADADIIALQEVERHWRRSGMRDQPAEIAALLPDRFWAYGAPFDVDAGERLADGRILNRRRQFGQMILSRWPILSSRMHILPKLDSGAVFNMTTGALEAVIATPAGPLRVYDVHLGHLETGERLAQIERLQAVLASAPAEGGVWNGREVDAAHWQSEGVAPPMPAPAILLGDFNAEPDSPEHRALTAGAEGARLVDSWLAAGAAAGSGVTFLADPAQGAFHDQRIDYCFLSASLRGHLRRAWTDDAADGSDHQPYWVEIEDGPPAA